MYDIVRGNNITLTSDGLARRAFCYISDATLAFLRVLLQGSPGEAYNIANPSAEISIRDLAYKLSTLYPERHVGVHFSSNQNNQLVNEHPIMKSLPSISKISELGWQPSVGLDEGFLRTIESCLLDNPQ